jgi:hypothetical protein
VFRRTPTDPSLSPADETDEHDVGEE